MDLKEQILNDPEITSITKDIVKLKKQPQTEDIKERISLLEKLRLDVVKQYSQFAKKEW